MSTAPPGAGHHGAGAERTRNPAPAALMARAAGALLDTLDEHERRTVRRSFPHTAARRDWTYLPGPRAGVALGELGRSQRKAVHALVATALRPHAYAQVAAIMALEDVLDRIEDGRRGRHSGDYWTVVFGVPGDEPWGWRFEGHHVSLNVTVADGRVAGTPCFLGANPAVVRHGDAVVSRPLVEEEDVARALLHALHGAARARAVIAEEAPADIVTRDRPRVDGTLEPAGVPAADLSGDAAALLRRLFGLYLDRLAEPVAAAEAERLGAAFGELHFAWAGAAEPRRPHYYRIQGPDLLIEYDNTQHGANHVHSVWRRPSGDFGGDLLARHHAEAHDSTG